MNSGQPPAPTPNPPQDDQPGVPATPAQPTGDTPPAEQAAQPAQAPENAQAPDNAQAAQSEQPATEQPTTPAEPAKSASGTSAPLARGTGPLAARGLGVAKPASPAVGDLSGVSGGQKSKQKSKQGSKPGSPKQSGQGGGKAFRPAGLKVPGEEAPAPATTGDTPTGEAAAQPQAKAPAAGMKRRIEVPNLRQPLSDDLMAELEAELASTDVDSMLKQPAGLTGQSASLEEGQQVRGTVLKIDADNVYVGLGGPNEGAVSIEQFEELPEVGKSVELIVRGFNREDSLYQLVVPGQALDVNDWEDLEEGTVVEAHVAAANTGGLEATVGSIRAFIPISQIALYRVEDTADFVGQRMVCVVTECNPRRKNLVLSRRAVLEREREQQRKEQLEKIEPGDTMEGTVTSIKDFGAFVDLGGLDGLIHISRLSWDNVKHPSDVLELGQKVKVKIEKIDKQTGKIALSYRDLLENPWDTIEASAPVGAVVTGTVTRLANFGAFVRIATGIEGLVHISEVASHRVSNVNSVLKEGEQVQVKVLSIERESQRVALSIKQAQSKASAESAPQTEEPEEPPRELAVRRQHAGPLKGGVGGSGADNPFGLNLG